MTKGIEKTSTVNGADVCAVLYAMVEEAVSGLVDGRIIRLGDLGSLRITLSRKGKAIAEEVTAAAVKKAGVIFTLGKKLQQCQIYKGVTEGRKTSGYSIFFCGYSSGNEWLLIFFE